MTTYVYTSATGFPVNIDSYIITPNPGLYSKYQIDALDAFVGSTLSRYDDGVLMTTDSTYPASLKLDSNNNVTGLVGPGGLTKVFKPASAIATRMFAGRMEYDFNNTSANTWEVLIALEQNFDSVRIIFGQSRNAGATTASPTMLATVAAVADTANATTDAATWTSVTVSAAGTWALTAGSAQHRRAFIVSDWISVSSVARTDGGLKPLLAVRAWVNGGNPLTLNGNSSGTDNFTNWATKPDGRIWKARKAAGNFASASQSGFTAAASTANEWPILGVQYVARGKVVTVMTFGDSIFEGRGTYLGEGFVMPAAYSMSDAENTAYEYCNLAWAGASTATALNAMTDVFAAGIIPDVAVFPMGSPNDISTTIAASDIATMRRRVANKQALCRTNNVLPVLCSWMPSNTAVKNYGSTDSLRVAYATDVEARTAKGLLVAATSTALSGTTSGGQVQINTAMTTDGIHPNDAGNAVLAVIVKAQLGRILA